MWDSSIHVHGLRFECGMDRPLYQLLLLFALLHWRGESMRNYTLISGEPMVLRLDQRLHDDSPLVRMNLPRVLKVS
jgi:hypothetical protein